MHLGLPWFGPKRGFGWGWTPVTWQGWVLTAIFLGLILFTAYAPALRHRTLLFASALALFLAIVALIKTRRAGRWSGDATLMYALSIWAGLAQ